LLLGWREPRAPRLLKSHDLAGAQRRLVWGRITLTRAVSDEAGAGMERMKDDMSGGAAAICAMAIGMLGAR
jgi:hypothetical protein